MFVKMVLVDPSFVDVILAQLAEHLTFNQGVVGSNPACHISRVISRLKTMRLLPKKPAKAK